ncbi:MAG: helix-turn-helix transcriptional regulator [Acidobacteria bacterium]|nr:helix-turn-helix transcriptional regulator [Acidobacteriota bacterium]
MGCERDLLALVSSIYDASTDPSAWPDFLNRLCDVLGGASGLILQHEFAEPRQHVVATARIDPVYGESYVDYYWRTNVWMKGVDMPMPDQGRLSEKTCSPSELVKTEFYQDFLRGQNVMHSVAACIRFDRGLASFCSFFRSRGAGAFDAGHIGLLTTLTPHLRRALELQDRTAMFRVQSAAALAALDTITMGCMLVEQTGRVLLANRAAEECLNARDGLWLSQGCLCAAETNRQERLRRLIFSAGATINGRGLVGGGALAVERPSGRPALHVLVIPFRTGAGPPRHRPAAIVFVTDPERELRPDREVLGVLFGLSPAESRVAAALLAGRSIEDCAAELAISRHTARNHLKAIFSKTGASRQGELMRLLLSSVARLKTDS